MRKTYISMVLVTLLLFLFSCNGGVDSPTSSNKKLVLDLKEASTIYIGKSSQSSSRDIGNGSSQNKIFKVTEDGHSQEVTYYYETDVYDNKGNVVGKKKEKVTEVMVPEKLIKLNENYLIVSFDYYNSYLVDTKTGYCFNYPFEPPYYTPYSYFYGESVQCDATGNIYTNDWHKLIKIDISDPQNLSVEQINPPTERMEGIQWAVDSKGNCAYRAIDELGNYVLRLKKKTGGYMNLPGDASSQLYFWQGLDGQIYYLCGIYMYNAKVKKIDNQNYVISDVDSDVYYYYPWKALLRAKNKNRIVAVAENEIYELYNPDTNKITKKQASAIGLNKIKFAVSSDDFYYFVGTDANNNCKVVKVDPVTYQYEYLLSDGEYDVYNLTVSKNSIVFNALRMSDGAIVMGRINNNGNIKILDDKLENLVTVLERIN